MVLLLPPKERQERWEKLIGSHLKPVSKEHQCNRCGLRGVGEPPKGWTHLEWTGEVFPAINHVSGTTRNITQSWLLCILCSTKLYKTGCLINWQEDKDIHR